MQISELVKSRWTASTLVIRHARPFEGRELVPNEEGTWQKITPEVTSRSRVKP
jgi:hypothetical protein